jgi:hypothetical protein
MANHAATCPHCGSTLASRYRPNSARKRTRAENAAQQARHDLQRYEAAMRAKREHERAFGPIRPPATETPRLRLVTDAMPAGATGLSSSCNSSRK